MESEEEMGKAAKRICSILLCLTMMLSLTGCRYSDVLEQIIYDHFRNEAMDEDPPFQPEENNPDNEDTSDDLNNLQDDENAERMDDYQNSQASPEGKTKSNNSSASLHYNPLAEANGVATNGVPSTTKTVENNTPSAGADNDSQNGAPSNVTGLTDQNGGQGTQDNGEGENGTSYDSGGSDTMKKVVDADGQEVEIPENINSVAATGPAAMMALILGGGDCLAASDADTVSAAAATGIFNNLSGTDALWSGDGNSPIGDAELQSLIAKKPDLVVEASGSKGLTDAQVGQLTSNGIYYLTLPPMTDLASVQKAVDTMAQVLGDRTGRGGTNAVEMAEKYNAWIEDACNAIGAATKDYEEKKDDDGNVIVGTTYTLYVDDWDVNAAYRLYNNRFTEMAGTGCAVVKIGPSGSCLTISNFLSYAHIVNTSSKYGAVMKSKYFTPLKTNNLTIEITGSMASGRVSDGQPLLQQDGASLGTEKFPYVIVSSEFVKQQIEASRAEAHGMWAVQSHINTGDGNFNSDGFLDQEGKIVATQISGNYDILVNPKGLVTDWTKGGCESILESLWAGWKYYNAISEAELKNYISDFYSQFYGYNLSAAEIDSILRGV